MFRVIINMEIEGTEVSDLRESVGWDRRDGDFPSLFTKCLFWAGVRDENGKLVGFGYVTGPGIEHGYIEDILVHPDYQRKGFGQIIVRSLLHESERQSISIITVTYQQKHQEFYVSCGFTPCPGGIWIRK